MNYLEKIEEKQRIFDSLSDVQKQVRRSAMGAMDCYDHCGCNHAWKMAMQKISRLTGIPFEVLAENFDKTDFGTSYDLSWLRNAGYDIPVI